MNKKLIIAGLIALNSLLIGALGVQAQTSNGAVTTAAPVYVNGTARPLSLDTAGNLRVIAAAGGGAANTNITQTCSVVLSLEAAAAAGCPLPVGGIYQTALPTYSTGVRTQFQTDARGALRAATTGVSAAGTDGFANNIVYPYQAGSQTSAGLFGATTLVFNGTTFDRMRGDLNGQWVQGNVAPGVTDAGNPVKIGGLYVTGAGVVTSGQRVDAVFSRRGSMSSFTTLAPITAADGRSNAQMGFPTSTQDPVNETGVVLVPVTGTYAFNGTTWDRDFTCTQTAPITVTAGATTQIVALSGTTVIRVCSFVTSISAAGTAAFVYGTGANCGTGTTAITGAMSIPANDNINMSSGNGSVFRAASANALCLTATGGNVAGFVTYAQY